MSHLNKKALGTGVAMVALSTFVPNPFLTGDAWAQASASDTMNITAKIVNPLGVSQLTKLNFGTFVSCWWFYNHQRCYHLCRYKR